MIGKKSISYRGKKVTVEKRTLKGGEIAYYRSGKRVTTQYQKRFVTGVLRGLTPQQSVGKGGHDFKQNFSQKAITSQELKTAHQGARILPSQRLPSAKTSEASVETKKKRKGIDVSLQAWGATFGSAKASEKSTYYADVEVTKKSLKRVGSDTVEDDSDTQVVTVQITRVRPDGSIQQTFSKDEIRYGFRDIVGDTFRRNRLQFANDSVNEDVISFWRHKDR